MDKSKTCFKTIGIVFISALLFIFPKEISESTILSIKNCVNIIIPSMFAFMVISSYIISSGIYRYIFAPLYLILKHFIKLDKCLFSIFILSLIGGYPVGIKLIKEIISQNKSYSEIAEVLSTFCYCISPTFAITMIGLGLFNNPETGLIIYISNVTACIIIAIFQSNRYNLKIEKAELNAHGGIINSINSSADVLFKICSIIVIFNIIITAFESFFNLFQIEIPIILKSLTEISNVVNIKNPNISLLPYLSAISSTGGACVLFQTYSLIGDDFSKSFFLISKLPCAVLSFFITKIILFFWDISLPVITETNNYIFELNSNRLILVLLLIMCVILLQKNEKNFKKG